MRAKTETKNKLPLVLAICLLIVAGIFLRLQSFELQPISSEQRDKQVTQSIVRFLKRHDVSAVYTVHYTNDSGIRGLQIPLSECRGNLQIAVMPEGDEFLSLWQSRSTQANYQNKFLFNNNSFDEFPVFRFWTYTMAYSLAQRLHLPLVIPPGPVVALAYPRNCQVEKLLPWQKLNTSGYDNETTAQHIRLGVSFDSSNGQRTRG